MGKLALGSDFQGTFGGFAVKFFLFEGIKDFQSGGDAAKGGVFAVQVGRGTQHEEERCGGGVRIVAAGHADDAADVFDVVAEFTL